MINILREVDSSIHKFIYKIPTYCFSKENIKLAKKNMVYANYHTNNNWVTKYNGNYILLPETVILDSEITIPKTPIVYNKTRSIKYNCVLLIIKELMKTVYCPVNTEFFQDLYIDDTNYIVSSDRRVINGKFILKKGLLYLERV